MKKSQNFEDKIRLAMICKYTSPGSFKIKENNFKLHVRRKIVVNMFWLSKIAVLKFSFYSIY